MMHTGVESILHEVQKVIVGKDDVLEKILMTILSGGHVLLDDVPGTGKTTTALAFSRALGLQYGRIQFTPDVLPSDIVGFSLYRRDSGTFTYQPGAVMTNLLLADEINRTPPKTQAALLEAMQEKQISNHGMRLPLPRPFFVLATQNPIEQEGTYPLPEAQLDRFMFLIRLTYPEREQEIAILRETTGNGRPAPQPVLNAEQLIYLQRCVREIPVSDHVIAYCADLARMSRPENPEAPAFIRENLSYGAGPRAGQYLLLAARAAAALEGRLNVSCADVRRFAPEVLRHRIACNFHAVGENLTSDMIVEQLIGYVPESAE